MGYEFNIKIDCSFEPILNIDGQWDQLLSTSNANTIFLTAGWLRAAFDEYGKGYNLLIPQIWSKGKLVAAAAFQERNGIIEFVGTGPSDYMDIVLSNSLTEDIAIQATEALLVCAQEASKKFRYFMLGRLPRENGTLKRLCCTKLRYFTTLKSTDYAPSMEMTVSDEKLRKKSLRRHERRLQRDGDISVETYMRAQDILPKLSKFFDQHIRRWQNTPYPSLFLDVKNQSFYRNVVRNLDHSGWLRFTEVRLDDRLIAAHFGFFHATRYTWYKPTYEPELSKRSPGEVLIKKLIEQAQEENAAEFDFTIGQEAFKYRFATINREIDYIHITDSWLRAFRVKAKQKIKIILKYLFGQNIFNRKK